MIFKENWEEINFLLNCPLFNKSTLTMLIILTLNKVFWFQKNINSIYDRTRLSVNYAKEWLDQLFLFPRLVWKTFFFLP